ncbi:oxidoreductase [Prauserella marina]|uniref:Gluconate 5-dehydrogenase/3-oxoacyl-[acyl-carrier protein] reductase n=1 Tax=Prauserella marina TaxID=530584 RepID=A0A222VSU9_9PSEU|nr:SDR family oxidoreductase [Prauserella marina]ASR36997.1 oxidoreductase [Prauserella marina]PWV80032.1 gluconate 5-dehydrogenase/3-oxoacyl-[acyl-carrier protein] reductase [Prauserella marina]SDD84689.1 gluconate 5-dehydrogenase/3-oxoacyl-[acyl-carrier protein] reductase [Prauserella marina]
MSRLEDQVAVVTGASPNIGGALAAGLAAQGARVVCTDISETVARAAAERIGAEGGEAVAVVGDVTDPGHADEVMRIALDRWGRVDVLVNNAVYFDQRGLLDMPVDAYRRQVDIILGGAFLFSRAAARAMISGGRGGSIVNVLSTAAWQGQPGNIGYSTAKSGLINFTRSVAMELAEHGIRVNGFTPTATQPQDPELVRQVGRLGRAEGKFPMDFAGQLPMRRLPTPDDYVGAVVFLAGPDSAMITGSNITVDAGATAKYWPWQPGHA